MHSSLISYIDNKIEEASTFVTRHLPVNLPIDNIYEGLVGEPHILEAFRNASRYLPSGALVKHVFVKFDDETYNCQVRLSPSEKYPVFLLPKYDLEVTHESELGQAMALARMVAKEWDTLTYVWEHFKTNVKDAHALGFVFPWLREVFLDFDFSFLPLRPNRKSEREEVTRDVAKLTQHISPRHFPRMSPDLNILCRSGKKLFGQYRMIEAATKEADLARAAMVINRGNDKLVPGWVIEHTNEAIDDWKMECEEIERTKKMRRRKGRF